MNTNNLRIAQNLIDEYSWILSLNDDGLISKIRDCNDIQNAIYELMGFLNDIVKEA